ncbi:metallophosphoesterase family protein [bacterium]|nr:metallophosphoesterase family protein [bacterium]
MKIAILSDIHGNCFALKSVLDAVEKNGIETLIIAGDFIGYYFWPVKVFNLLKDYDPIVVRGNHDKMLKKAKEDTVYLEKICKKYGNGLKIALDQLGDERIEWLSNLPDLVEYETQDGKILICHGSPWDGDEYVYPDSDDDSLNRYAQLDTKWIIQGHTHYSMHIKIGDITLINPGSVGQPRDKKLGAHWALLDTNLNKVDFYCEQYNIKTVIKESRERHSEIPYLANILEKQ